MAWERLKHGEEIECERCGFPHFAGDKVWMVDEWTGFCGKRCAKEHKRARQIAQSGGKVKP